MLLDLRRQRLEQRSVLVVRRTREHRRTRGVVARAHRILVVALVRQAKTEERRDGFTPLESCEQHPDMTMQSASADWSGGGVSY